MKETAKHKLINKIIIKYIITWIDTYVTVPIDARITLQTYGESFSICIFISLTPAYMYLEYLEYTMKYMCEYLETQ